MITASVIKELILCFCDQQFYSCLVQRFTHKVMKYDMSVFGVILIRIFPAFSRIRTECGQIRYLSLFSPNAGKCGKNADQNNSEYGHFLRSVSRICFQKTCFFASVNPLEVIKKAFYFILNALSVLKIFKVLFWFFFFFGLVGKRFDKKAKVNFKYYDVYDVINGE